MAENLNVTHYQNGEIIIQNQIPDEWVNMTSPFYFSNGIYGKLQNRFN